MKNKKSQGSIIVTILLVLIAIGAIAIAGVFIIGLVRENAQVDNIKADFSIDPKGTFFDTASTQSLGNLNPSSNQVQVIYVKVDSTTDNSKVAGLKFIFKTGGNSIVCTTAAVPSVFESHTYRYIAEKPDSVDVVPFILINGKQKNLGVMATTTINAINKSLNVLNSKFISMDSCSGGNLPDEKVSV